MRKTALVLVAAFCALAASRTPARDTVVLVVRHAEKAGPTGDVPLSAEGESRALALRDIARRAGVQAIITTQFLRTKQTAAPLAMDAAITPVVIDAGANVADHAAKIASRINSDFAGQVVLVVGHSNTVPAIVAALGGTKDPDLCDSEYDRLYVVTVSADGARVVRARYGAPSAADAACAAMR